MKRPGPERRQSPAHAPDGTIVLVDAAALGDAPSRPRSRSASGNVSTARAASAVPRTCRRFFTRNGPPATRGGYLVVGNGPRHYPQVAEQKYFSIGCRRDARHARRPRHKAHAVLWPQERTPAAPAIVARSRARAARCATNPASITVLSTRLQTVPQHRASLRWREEAPILLSGNFTVPRAPDVGRSRAGAQAFR